MSKFNARHRRAAKTKARIRLTGNYRLVVFRSTQHIYAQIVTSSSKGDLVHVTCSTIDKTLKGNLAKTKVEQANQVGKLLAERAKEKQIDRVAFDRAGYKYHGRVKAVADAAREAGLIF